MAVSYIAISDHVSHSAAMKFSTRVQMEAPRWLLLLQRSAFLQFDRRATLASQTQPTNPSCVLSLCSPTDTNSCTFQARRAAARIACSSMSDRVLSAGDDSLSGTASPDP